MLVIAHRACPLHAPENSLAGIRKAAELGADAVEIDVRRTLEGVPVLMHDWSPRRTTGLPGPVALYPYSLLRRARLDGQDEHVPSLEEALAALPDNLALFIDIKDGSVAPQVLSLVRERKLEGQAAVISYSQAAVRYVAGHAPEMATWLLRDDTDAEGLRRYLEEALRCGAGGISPHWDAVEPEFVAEAHRRGLKVYSMNRDLETVVEKASAGLDGIVTDNPREVREILEDAPR